MKVKKGFKAPFLSNRLIKITQKLQNQEISKKCIFYAHLRTGSQDRALRKLRQVDAAINLDDLKNPPSNHLEELKGNRNNQVSIRINDQWRICFLWRDGESYDVQIVDYHK